MVECECLDNTLELVTRRRFHWGVFAALVALYVPGNLAGISLLHKTDAPIEPGWFWGGNHRYALVIALSLVVAHHIGLAGIGFWVQTAEM